MPVVLILNSLLEVEDKILEHELQTTTKFITHKVSNSKHLNIRIEGKREMSHFSFIKKCEVATMLCNSPFLVNNFGSILLLCTPEAGGVVTISCLELVCKCTPPIFNWRESRRNYIPTSNNQKMIVFDNLIYLIMTKNNKWACTNWSNKLYY